MQKKYFQALIKVKITNAQLYRAMPLKRDLPENKAWQVSFVFIVGLWYDVILGLIKCSRVIQTPDGL